MKKLSIALITFLLFSCQTNNSLKVTNVTTNKAIPSVTPTPSLTPSPVTSPTFDNFPNVSDNTSLEDQYNLQDYVEKNNILNSIPYYLTDGYVVRFTSDGGPAFFTTKAETLTQSSDTQFVWKRTPKKLIFDTFQLVNILSDKNSERFYSRYSQIIDNEITVNKNSSENLSKRTNLVQSVGLSLVRGRDGFKINNLTPIVIRQIQKKELPYNIENLSIKFDNGKNINIESQKTLIPWPGIRIDKINDKKLSLEVKIDFINEYRNNVALVSSINGTQFQMSKIDDNTFKVDNISIPELKSGSNNSLILELIDKVSLESDTKFSGYTWVIPLYQ